MRIGICEMKQFSKLFFKGVKDDTFFESCGVADVITTCLAGRNRKVAKARAETGKSFDVLEKEMLNGQKLQGTLTSKDVNTMLNRVGKEGEFPLFTAVYRIVYDDVDPNKLLSMLHASSI